MDLSKLIVSKSSCLHFYLSFGFLQMLFHKLEFVPTSGKNLSSKWQQRQNCQVFSPVSTGDITASAEC